MSVGGTRLREAWEGFRETSIEDVSSTHLGLVRSDASAHERGITAGLHISLFHELETVECAACVLNVWTLLLVVIPDRAEC